MFRDDGDTSRPVAGTKLQLRFEFADRTALGNEFADISFQLTEQLFAIGVHAIEELLANCFIDLKHAHLTFKFANFLTCVGAVVAWRVMSRRVATWRVMSRLVATNSVTDVAALDALNLLQFLDATIDGFTSDEIFFTDLSVEGYALEVTLSAVALNGSHGARNTAESE